MLGELRFFERNTRRLPWDIILCVDQSGSMADSVIHSAVMAGILSGLPSFRVRLVVFDTSVVDLSDQVDDPVEVLMRVQLGGGTDIAQALRYCGPAGREPRPHRRSSWSPTSARAGRRRAGPGGPWLAEDRVKLLGLAALDGEAHPFYDRAMAEPAGRPRGCRSPR